MASGVKDSLYDALVSDEMPKNQTLEEHDKQHHHGHFDPSTQSCKFRDEMEVETDTDKADDVDVDREGGGNGELGYEGKKSLVTAEEDAAYMEAVNNGDMETAAKMVREAAARAYPNTKVVEEGGKPKVVYHGSTNDFTEFDYGKIGSSTDQGLFGSGFYFSDHYPTAEQYALREAKEGIKGKVFEVFLNVTNPICLSDFKSSEEIARILDADPYYFLMIYDFPTPRNSSGFTSYAEFAGYDGSIVKHKDGSSEIVAFTKDLIKSADPVTHYDDGSIVPLSKRFGGGEDIRFAIGKDEPFPYEQEEKDVGKDIRHSITDGEEAEPFSEEFWAEVHPERGSSYSSEFGEDAGEQEHTDIEAYKANFTKDGKYKMPFKDGKFSKEIMERANKERGEKEGVWTEESRAEAEAAGRVLSNLLGGVSFDLSDVAYGEINRLSGDRYTWESLISKEEIPLTRFQRGIFAADVTPKEMIQIAKESVVNAGGKQTELGLTLDIPDFGDVIVVGKSGLKHGLRGFGRYEEVFSKTNADILPQIGDILKKSIIVNEMSPRMDKDKHITGSTILLGAAIDDSNEIVPVVSIIAHAENTSRENPFVKIYPLKSIDAKNLKDRQGFQPPLTPSSSMGVSIPQMIEKIKGVVPIFSQDIYNHFNDKRTDGVYENLRFRNTAGKVVGEYDRKTGKITLYPGAKVKDVVHEFSHGLWQYSEQESKAGRTGLQDKLHQIAKSAPEAVKDAVGRNYAGQNPNVILEECFTHEMARKSEQNKEFAKAISTARGKKWYQRAWGAIKETYAGFSRKMGWDKADLGKLEKMNAHDAADWILKQMANGKRIGDVRPEEKSSIQPWGTDDVPEEEQIVRK